MPDISICLPYYMNPAMLARHYRVWAGWSDAIKARVEIVIVDDGSPTGPAVDVARPAGLPELSIYRVLVDKPWHQHGARNLAAERARGTWLVMTDMDHGLSEKAVGRLLGKIDSGHVADGSIYTFHRVDALTGLPVLGRRFRLKPHPNSFFLTRDTYWRIGGYDEDLCGMYGTDIAYRWRAFTKARKVHLADVPLKRYAQWYLRDAATTTLTRKDPQTTAMVEARIAEKRQLGVDAKVPVLTFEWTQAL